MGLTTLVINFLLLMTTGILISRRIFKGSNEIFLLGSGMLVSLLGLLLISGLTSYLLKGFISLRIIFYCYITLTIFWASRDLRLSSILYYVSKLFSKQDFLLKLFLCFYILSIFLISSTFDLGGDSDVYFGIATSFARGNYPSHLPWQPNFLTSYHMGAFIVEGVIYATTQAPIYNIHCFFSAYIVSALFLIIAGIARAYTRSRVIIIPAVFGIIMFSVPVFLVNGFGTFLSDLFQFIIGHQTPYLLHLSSYPQLIDFKGSIGSGSADFFGLLYRNFYPFALATFILILYSLAIYKWGDRLFKKYFITTIFLALSLSIDESFFFSELLLIIVYFFIDFRKQPLIKTVKYSILFFTIFATLFLGIQNSLRDALLNPSLESPRFKILIPGGELKTTNQNQVLLMAGDQDLIQTINGKSVIGQVPLWYIWKNFNLFNGSIKLIGNTSWLLPNLLLVSVVALLLAILTRSKMAVLLSATSLVSLMLSQFTVYTFFPPTSLRFINQSSQLASIAYGFIFISLWCMKQNRLYKAGLLLLILFTIGPQIISSHARLIDYYTSHPLRNNFNSSSLSYEVTLRNISNIIPYDGRIIFIDSYPLGSGASNIVSEAIARFGFFVPVSPPDVKVVSPEGATEWVDATLSLNPPALKQLGAQYVFIQNSAKAKLANYGVDIHNVSYFIPIYTDSIGTLYSIRPAYIELPNQPFSVDNFIRSVPAGKTVYLDRFNLVEMRRGLVLRLAKKSNLIGPGFSGGGDFFLYIETFLPFTYICEGPNLPDCTPDATRKFEPVDYIITEPKRDIHQIINGSFSKVVETPVAVLWKNNE